MHDELENDGESPGVLGDGSSKPGKANLATVRRAIREEWPITPEVRQKLIGQMAKILGDDQSKIGRPTHRTQVAAARVLVAADSVNVRREELDIAADKPSATLTVNNVSNQTETRYVMLDDGDANGPQRYVQRLINGRVVMQIPDDGRNSIKRND